MTEEKNLEMNEINEQALEETAGGSKNYDYVHDLSRFIVRHVHGVVHYDSTSCLTMRKTPNGEVRRDPGPRLLHRGRLALRLPERQIRLR